jgi:hypothetical protein
LSRCLAKRQMRTLLAMSASAWTRSSCAAP